MTFTWMSVKASKSRPAEDKAKLPAKELRELSNTIKAADIYLKEKYHKLGHLSDSLRLLTKPEERFRLALEISESYRPLNTDSASKYAAVCSRLASNLPERYKYEAQIAKISAYATAGIFVAALPVYDSIQPARLPDDLKVKYWISGRMLFGYLWTYVEGNDAFRRIYFNRYEEVDDSLLRILPEDNKFRHFIECERLVTEGHFKEAQERLMGLLKELPEESNIYGMASYQLASVYKNFGDSHEQAVWLARSAISDIKGCTNDGLALPALAYWLYQHGELDESYNYINFALEETTQGNVRMRAVTIAQFMPLIDDAYRKKIQSSRDELIAYFVLVVILLVITGFMLFMLLRQVKRRKSNEQKLAKTAKLQESYIGNFIGLYSTYADRLTRLTQLVSMKLASGQHAELQKLMDSGKFTDQDNDDIHKIFDQAFLDIYPDFVEGINNLLRPEEHIILKNPQSLTPELRVYAFVRLGVEESTRIATILHYSTNTVYAYRNRMRNRAINRETFDSDVMEIGKDPIS